MTIATITRTIMNGNPLFVYGKRRQTDHGPFHTLVGDAYVLIARDSMLVTQTLFVSIPPKSHELRCNPDAAAQWAA